MQRQPPVHIFISVAEDEKRNDLWSKFLVSSSVGL